MKTDLREQAAKLLAGMRPTGWFHCVNPECEEKSLANTQRECPTCCTPMVPKTMLAEELEPDLERLLRAIVNEPAKEI